MLRDSKEDPDFPMNPANSANPKNAMAPLNGGHRSLLAFLLLFAAELVAVFLAGGPRQVGMGLFLAVAGLVMILLPLQRVAQWWLWPMGVLLILAVSGSLMPAGLVGTASWRESLVAMTALHLPSMVSVDPLGTVFWIGMLAVSLLIVIYGLTSPLQAHSMERVALLAVLGCSLYAVVAWIAWQTGWHYPFFVQESWAQPAFGFFTNRNQTAGFLLTGAILSLGLIHRGMNGGNLLVAMIAGTAGALLVAVLFFFSHSRGGLIFLLAGAVIWIAGLGKFRSRLLLPCFIGLFLFIGILFLKSGNELLERFKGRESEMVRAASGGSSILEHDPRIGIAMDTARMIRDLPITGSGLGTYAEVYPFYADKSLRDKTTALHAESDWLTLASEAGLPAVLVAFSGLALLLARIPKLREESGRRWPLRWAFLSACFAELLHGFFDVPLHKPELGWWIMLLGSVGFALPAEKTESNPISLLIQRVVFIVAGVATLGLGVWMIRAQWSGVEVPPPFAVSAAQKQLVRTYGEGDDASVKLATEELSAAILKYPMAHPLYFQLGALFANNGSLKQALDLFAVERALSPNDSIAVFEQGKTFASLSPDDAVELWREALRRQLRLDRLPNCPIQRAPELFGQMIQIAQTNSLFAGKMSGLASMSAALRMTWLRSPSCDQEMIAAAVQDAEFMHQLSPKEQAFLLEMWWQRGDRKAVADFIDSHPEYALPALNTKAAMLLASGQSEQACKMLMQAFGLPMPAKTPVVEAIRPADGDIPSEPIAAAKFYLERGNIVAARHILSDASMNAKSSSDQAEILFLRSQLEMSAGNWTSAFPLLTGYLHVSGRL